MTDEWSKQLLEGAKQRPDHLFKHIINTFKDESPKIIVTVKPLTNVQADSSEKRV